MRRTFAALFCIASCVSPSIAMAGPGATAQFDLRVRVPVVCRISFESALSDAGDGTWELGRTNELCNNGSGYFVTAIYEQNTLVGAEMIVGGRKVTLDGSGRAVVYAATTAANVSRDVAITPGEAGFDTELLTFAIQAA